MCAASCVVTRVRTANCNAPQTPHEARPHPDHTRRPEPPKISHITCQLAGYVCHTHRPCKTDTHGRRRRSSGQLAPRCTIERRQTHVGKLCTALPPRTTAHTHDAHIHYTIGKGASGRAAAPLDADTVERKPVDAPPVSLAVPQLTDAAAVLHVCAHYCYRCYCSGSICRCCPWSCYLGDRGPSSPPPTPPGGCSRPPGPPSDRNSSNAAAAAADSFAVCTAWRNRREPPPGPMTVAERKARPPKMAPSAASSSPILSAFAAAEECNARCDTPSAIWCARSTSAS